MRRTHSLISIQTINPVRCSLLGAALACSGVALPAAAQQGSQQAAWQRLEATPAHTRVEVVTARSHTDCLFNSANDAGLACTSARGQQHEFARTEIREVKLPKRSHRTLRGAALGFGLGAGIGSAVGLGMNGAIQASNVQAAGAGAAVGGVGLGLMGALIGYSHDLSPRQVLYQRP